MKVNNNPSIPPPPPRRSWPFAEIKIGGYFFVPRDEAKGLRANASQYAKMNPPVTFRCLTAKEDYENDDGTIRKNCDGLRVWRLT